MITQICPTKDETGLADLATRINEEFAKCVFYADGMARHAIKLGELLVKAKEVVGHGFFGSWLQTNCGVGEREAQRYMLVARNRERFEAEKSPRGNDLSLRGALTVLSKDAERAEEEQSCESEDSEYEDEPEEEEDLLVAEHLRRLKAIRRLARKRKRPRSILETDILLLVGKETRSFVNQVVELARKHGERLCEKRFQEQGYDAEFIAMFFLHRARERLKPAEAFAPPLKKGTMPPPEW